MRMFGIKQFAAAAVLAIASASSHATFVLDDFSQDQSSFAAVTGPMVFGSRNLSGSSPLVRIAGGRFTYESGSTQFAPGISYPGAGQSGAAFDFTQAGTLVIDWSATLAMPSLTVTLLGPTFQNSASVTVPGIAGGGPLAGPTLLPLASFNAQPAFSFANVVGLRLTTAALVAGEGTFSIDSLSVTGTIAPVPEPSTWLMLLAGLGLAGALARRRRA